MSYEEAAGRSIPIAEDRGRRSSGNRSSEGALPPTTGWLMCGGGGGGSEAATGGGEGEGEEVVNEIAVRAQGTVFRI
jgi:hypothetical protein